jgi:hypothetical protein
LGVTIIAVLAAIGGVLGLLGSLGLLALGGAIGAAGARAGLLFGSVLLTGLILLVLSVAYLAFAYGAWTLKPWGWTLGIGLAAISAVVAVLQLIGGDLSSIISIAISAVIIYYLMTPQVKAAFGRT